jgi:uncharacterized membrane protein YebE (DUF533 family)
MGLLMRRRRPVMRMAGAAALGTVAYQSGKRHEAAQGSEEAPPPQQYAEPAPAPAAAPPAPAGDTTAELERLSQLHQSGALTDDEFSAAKAKLLGI